MTSEEATQKSAIGDNSKELDQAIDELRGVLKKDDTESDEAPPARRATDRQATAPVGRETAAAAARKAGSIDEMSIASGKAFQDFGNDGPVRAASHGGSAATATAVQMDLIMDIPIDVQIVLGTSRMPVSALMTLSEGSTIALARKIGEPVEITVNGRVIGHGEITVLDEDESRFGVRLTEVIKSSKG